MELHLNYTPPLSPVKITHADKIVLIGSCFADNTGEKFLDSKFQALVNPNGILFNPVSIATALHSYIQPKTRNSKPETSRGLFVSFDHHGSFSSTTKKELEQKINSSRKQAHQFLKEAKFLIITLGSAFAYRHLKTNSIVANCHKLPQQDFKKELLPVETIVAEYTKLIAYLKKMNPALNIIFTVSPVKYLRDGIIENNISKSTLLLAINLLRTTNQQLPTFYFPAFELVNDDLRDYRFYKEDMAHPNEQAINYVWKKFTDCYFNDDTKKLNYKIKEVTLALNHRPFKANSKKYFEFRDTILKKCTELENSYPFLNFSEEKEQLINQ